MPKLSPHEVTALQLTADPKENASPEQQALAIKVITEMIALIDAEPVRETNNDRDACFLSGRVFVGKEVQRQRRINVGEMTSENIKR
jgi:hypothetical protein